MTPLLPGSTIGILGSGQLGRMLALAAHRMGYHCVVYSPARLTPAGRVADAEIAASYEDHEALRKFARQVDVVTVEFENIPVEALETLEALVPVRPGPGALFRTQNRSREKAFLAENRLPHVLSVPVDDASGLTEALEQVGMPAILKTAGFGYDGKGQLRLGGGEDLPAALVQLDSGPGILERFVEFRRELSVVVARSTSGEMSAYPPIENRHHRHILDLSSSPAGCSPATADQAVSIAKSVAEALDAVGVLCVEFFELDDGNLLVNEIAPRPHNSGHLTIEACSVSQFEQQLRAVCGLPLAPIRTVRPAAMVNLLGELWERGEPDWLRLLDRPEVSLHLYGKGEARPGRKMGHLSAVADTVAAAVAAVEGAREALKRSND